jgi:hypothetical protein
MAITAATAQNLQQQIDAKTASLTTISNQYSSAVTAGNTSLAENLEKQTSQLTSDIGNLQQQLNSASSTATQPAATATASAVTVSATPTTTASPPPISTTLASQSTLATPINNPSSSNSSPDDLNQDAYLNSILDPLRKNGINFQTTLNPLNKYDRYTYHLKLMMTTDADSSDPQIRSNLINNKISQMVVIAESGVTTGFNIVDCEIKDVVGSGFRNRNSITTEINITLTEPYGLTLPDKLYLASQSFSPPVQDWKKIPLFLEVSFRYYDEDGVVVSKDKDKIGTKLYKLIIVDFGSTLTEVGSTYKINTVADGNLGFRDNYFIIPVTFKVATGGGVQKVNDSITLQGDTVGAFFSTLGKNMTEFYRNKRQGGGPTDNLSDSSSVMPIIVYNFVVAPILANESINFQPTQNSRRLSFSGGTGGEITIGGVSIGALVDDIMSSLKNDKFFFKDTKAGFVRVPRIECRVKNIGWDFYSNDYVREFTYFIGIKESNRPVPSQQLGSAFQTDPSLQNYRMQELVSTVSKAYTYYYTGNNSEITSLNIEFNQMHLISLPFLNGTTVPDSLIASTVKTRFSEINKLNQTYVANNAKIASINSQQDSLRISNTSATGLVSSSLASSAFGTQTRATPDASVDPLDLLSTKATIQADNASIQAQIQALKSNGIAALGPDISEFALYDIKLDSTLTTSDAASVATASAQNNQLAKNLKFAEAFNSPQLSTKDPSALTYVADPRDIVNNLARPPNTETTPSRLLNSTIMAQLYDRNGADLADIELEIRGDPYWFGLTNLERAEELEQYLPGGTSFSGPSNEGVSGAATNLLLGQIASNPLRKNTMNSYDNDANFIVVFRAGTPPSEDDGLMHLNKNVDFFNAVYTAIEVTHMFRDGKFLQRLHGIRENLVNLSNQTAATSQVSGAPNPTQPPVAPPSNVTNLVNKQYADLFNGNSAPALTANDLQKTKSSTNGSANSSANGLFPIFGGT